MFDPSFLEMAKRSDANPSRWRRPLLQWLDDIEAGWTVPALLAGFVAAWTLYLIIAYQGAGLHPDVLEAWTLGRSFEWGNSKHPPLMGWIARLWTEIFPLQNWSMQLMAMVNAGFGLWAVDVIARRFVTGDKRILILLLLMLTPAYQFHAQRFNANSVLLSLWPLATYCFLRSFETCDALWGAAAGITAALAMLGKYYSIFLIAAFVFAAVSHPARKLYLASPAPFAAVISGMIALTPHLLWMMQTGAPTIEYARAHILQDWSSSFHEMTYFLLGLIAAMSVSAATWILIAGRRLSHAATDFAIMKSGLKLLLLVGAGTIVFPVLACLIVGTDLPSLWALQGLFLFVVPVVASTQYPIERFYTVNTLILTVLFVLASVVVVAPVHALYRNREGYKEGRSFYGQAAIKLTQQWHQTTQDPLTIISGDDALAFAVAFYSPDHPRCARSFAHQYTWDVSQQAMLENGWAALCFAEQVECIDSIKTAAEKAHRHLPGTFEVRATLFGMLGVRRNVVTVIVPPEGK